MRLLHTRTGHFVDFVDNDDLPHYAILSHVWDTAEQVYQELREIQKDYDKNGHRKQRISPPPSSIPFSQSSHICTCTTHTIESKPLHDLLPETSSASPSSIWEDVRLSPKVRDACGAARADGYDFIWIDSCCIDKTSSSEVSEAINSMYRWYGLAMRCYAFLADVPDMEEEDLYKEGSSFRKSKWFKRGWTLQELIAPEDVAFMSNQWNALGSKFLLADLVESITGIEVAVLVHEKPLDRVSVAARMSWAAMRETTRIEDRAYSLFGIFGVNMSTLYGEESLAFRRLQLSILERIPDQSIFAWSDVDQTPYLNPLPLRSSQETAPPDSNILSVDLCLYGDERRTLLADSPRAFHHSRHICPVPHHAHRERLTRLGVVHKDDIQYYTSTPHGIRTELLLLDVCPCLPPEIVRSVGHADARWYLAILGCESSDQDEDHFLARVCYSPSLQPGLEFLRPGYLCIEQLGGKDVLPDIVMLSYSQVEQCFPHLAAKIVYIPHPKHTQLSASGQRALRCFPNDVHIVPPPRWASTILEAQGYTSIISQPSADGPCSCRLTLSKSDEAIHIRCWGEKPDRDGDMVVHAEASITTDNLQSASDDRSTSSDSVRIYHRERQKVLDVDATTAAGTEYFIVVLKRISKSGLVVYAKIADAVPESDEDDDGECEMQTSQGTRKSKVTVSWER